MTRPRLLAALACALVLPLGCGDAPPAPDTRPDLVLVVIDTLRADRLSTYGYPRPTSPRIDRLAAEGVRFDDVTAQSSWTQPSVASLLTGRHLYVNAHRLPASVPSLAERLAEAGYETAAFVANPNLSAEGGYDRGFQSFVTRDDTGGQTWDAPDLEGAVNAWLAAHPAGDAPRFLYLHYLDPHWPYAPVEDDPLPGEPLVREDTRAAWAAARAADPAVDADFDAVRASMLADLDAYDREIAVVDRSLARLLDATQRGRERLVVVASDHGEGLWDHRDHASRVQPPGDLRERFFRDHSYHMWQELLFTPLIVQGVGFPRGAVVGAPVQNVDILPTLLRAAGLPLDAEGDGVPLQELVAKGGAPSRLIVSHSNEGTALRQSDDPLKFVFPTDTGFSFGMPIQAYTLDVDPHERANLHDAVRDDASHPQRAQLLKLMRAREERAAAFHLFDGESSSASAEQQKVLAELGYLGGDDAAPPPVAPPPSPTDDADVDSDDDGGH